MASEHREISRIRIFGPCREIPTPYVSFSHLDVGMAFDIQKFGTDVLQIQILLSVITVTTVCEALVGV